MVPVRLAFEGVLPTIPVSNNLDGGQGGMLKRIAQHSIRSSRALVAALAGICATASLANERPATTAFAPGEQSTYQIHYLGMNAGVAHIVVGPRTSQWGQDVWPITTHARSDRKLFFYPIRDRFVSYWDYSADRTIGSDFYVDEKGKKRHQRIQLDHATGSAKVYKSEKNVETTVDVAVGTNDIASATFALRNQELAVGREFAVPVFTGAKSFVMNAKVLGKQEIKTPLGKREVFKVRASTDFSGKLKSKRDIYAYFTTDSAHVPVRIEAEFVLGSVIAELVLYSPGRVAARETKSTLQDG